MEKRLYKSNKNKMIDGVCADIALALAQHDFIAPEI